MDSGQILGCPACLQASPGEISERGHCTDPAVLEQIARDHPHWLSDRGDCPGCVQQAILHARLRHGDSAMHRCVERLGPIHPELAFAALSTPIRMHADPRFTGKGVTVAQIDSGFYPHPDLTEPRNRIRAWAETVRTPIRAMRFRRDRRPQWPGWDGGHSWQWHGLMTTAAAFGNGCLSHGVYRGLASDAELVLVQTWNGNGHITNRTLIRSLNWIRHKRAELNIRIVSISVAGDPVRSLEGNAVDAAVRALVREGVVVIAAAGNSCEKSMLPPATALEAITVGGLDDCNVLDRGRHSVWHSTFHTHAGGTKPEIVAPSLWVVAPMLPGSPTANEANELFTRRAAGDHSMDYRMAEQKLVTRHYQHVEGTSFAAPLVASIVACMLEADPSLTPERVREILIAAAYKVPGAADERQGAGAVDAGRALELTLAARK